MQQFPLKCSLTTRLFERNLSLCPFVLSLCFWALLLTWPAHLSTAAINYLHDPGAYQCWDTKKCPNEDPTKENKFSLQEKNIYQISGKKINLNKNIKKLRQNFKMKLWNNEFQIMLETGKSKHRDSRDRPEQPRTDEGNSGEFIIDQLASWHFYPT